MTDNTGNVVSNTETVTNAVTTNNVVSNLETVSNVVVSNVETAASKTLSSVETKLTSIKNAIVSDVENIPEDLYTEFKSLLDDGYAILNEFEDWVESLPGKAATNAESEVKSLWSDVVSWFTTKHVKSNVAVTNSTVSSNHFEHKK